jgi:PTS system nitrogen regulatory IIA component
MDLRDILSPAAVVAGVRATSKKQLFQRLAAAMAPLAGAEERAIVDAVMERERLGSTGFGGGVAIPHGKLPGLPRVMGLLATLADPVDYDAIDGLPVDIAFLLLAPEDAGAEHLKALARVSRTFRDRALVEKLKGSTSPDALYAMLVGVPAGRAV